MIKKLSAPITASDEDVRALLARYKCPVPFHEVRTRFLGNIATPVMGISPIKMVESLWGGRLPEFDTLDAANVLVGSLIMGLWNRLTRHQDRSAPFRLTRVQAEPTREELATLALMRCQELDGFIEGLFGGQEVADLPERAGRSLKDIGEFRGLFGAALNVVKDNTIEATTPSLETTLRHMREITKNAEHEMHAVVLACKRARQSMLGSYSVTKPTLH
jgi:hypothetical protein